MLLALFVTFLWSTSWVLVRIGLDADDGDLSPLTFAGMRYALAAVVLAVVVCTTPQRRSIASIGRRDLGRLALLGIVLVGVTQGAQFVAIDTQPAATTSLVLATTPLAVTLLSRVALGEHTTAAQRTGGVVIVAGAATFFAGDLGATAVGLTAALVCLGANTASALLGRGVNRHARISPVVVSATTMIVGAAGLVIVGLATGGVPSVSARTWLITAWLAVVNTALAFTLWNRALRHLGASEASAMNTTMVIQIPVLGWLFLDEPLGVAEITGILAVAAGVFVMTRPRQSISSG